MAIIVNPPQHALRVLPNNDRYKCRFEVASETSDRVYMISFDMAQKAWVCSCRGCISTGLCKHLKANGMKGRKTPDQRQFEQFQLSTFVRAASVGTSIVEHYGKDKPIKKEPVCNLLVAEKVRKVLGLKPIQKALPPVIDDDAMLEE